MNKSTITRERLEQLADNNTICKVSWDERLELARIALAAMNGEPVAEVGADYALRYISHGPAPKEGLSPGDKLYLHAQPSTVVQGEAASAIEELKRTLVDCNRYNYCSDAIARVESACRAAMLAATQQSPGSEPDTVPGKWISVSERLPEEGGRYWCYVEEQNSLGKSHYQWNCSWNGEIWGGAMMHGRVTHWMELPAAPQEVVNGQD